MYFQVNSSCGRQADVTVRLFFYVLLIAAAVSSTTNSSAASESTSTIARRAPDWELEDTYGKKWQSSSFFDGGKATAIVFLGTECPLAKLYAAKIASYAKEFEDRGVKFCFIDSNVQDSLLEMQAFVRKQSLEIPFLKDPNAAVADQYDVKRTPEVVIVDGHRRIVYQGRIDDQYGIGYTKKKAEQSELTATLDDLINDKEVFPTRTASVGCLIGRNVVKQTTDVATASRAVTFSKDVSRVLQRRCVACHREGEIGPMSLESFDDCSAWSEMIAEVVHNKRMPPWHADPDFGSFANDRSMTFDEVQILNDWIDQGTPEGDKRDLPEPLAPNSVGWQASSPPDFIVSMAAKPFSVPATATVDYQYFSVDPKLTEDRWIQAYQIRPGNRNVVHHVLLFAKEPNHQGKFMGERGYLAGYVPGTRVTPYPAGMAKRLVAGSKLIFQVHYTPTGTAAEDLSDVGFWFAPEESITHEIKTFSAVQTNFQIPPRESNFTTVGSMKERLPDCLLLSMSPHMHVRGKSFQYDLVDDEKKATTLLKVPHYDFGWQTAYLLKEPLAIRSGSRIRCRASFDNSTSNLNNPDPTRWVTWGDQTSDEMMIGYFDYAVTHSENSLR